MLMDCKCGTNVEAKLDEATDQVMCMDCGEEIQVSSFTKTSMKQRREVVQRATAKIPPNGLLATCDNKQCGKDFSAEFDAKRGSVFCPHCEEESNLSSVAMNLLKENHIFTGYTKRFFEQEGKDSEDFIEDIEAEIAKDAQNIPKEAKKRGRPKGAKNKDQKEVELIKVEKEDDLPTKEDLVAVRDQLGSADSDNSDN